MFPVLLYLLCIFGNALTDVVFDPENPAISPKLTDGGTPTTIESHPFAVSISVNGDYIGAGAIVGSRWVLTTADNIQFHPISQVQLRIGSTLSNEGGHLLHADQIRVHEGYDGKFVNNLALIRTRDRIQLGTDTKEIELAGTTPPPGTLVELCGWGTASILDDPKVAHTIKEGTMITLSLASCTEQLWNYDVSNGNLCTAAPNLATCRFGGGDLLVYDKKLLGLNLGNPTCSSDGPTVFVDIPQLKNWIKSQIEIAGK